MCLGIPGKIVSIVDEAAQLALVDVSGVQREVNIACVLDEAASMEAHIGDWVLVHVGFALSKIDEEEAQKTLEILEELGEVQEELEAMQNSEV